MWPRSLVLSRFRGRQAVVCRGAWRRGLAKSTHDEEEKVASYWRDLDRRVSNRKPRVAGPGVPTGRGPRRKTEMDFWDAAGLFDFGGGAAPSVPVSWGRLSRGRVKGSMTDAVAFYENRVAPLLRQDDDFIDLTLLVDQQGGHLTSVSTWRTGDAFHRVASTDRYQEVVKDFATQFFDLDSLESHDVDVRTVNPAS
mmetsp:Transcript_36964/g.118491  ORF Transcript_36964/g.118491 Transcript_36964/m.118491 type:complete len:196 (+) Transcript_36964:42-629(+)